MPIPGPRTIYSNFPKVLLTLKMQKSQMLTYWWMNDSKDFAFKLGYIYSYAKQDTKSYVAAPEAVKLFQIFTERKYSWDEMLMGIKLASDFGDRIHEKRQEARFEPTSDKIINEQKRHLKAINKKIYEIYRKRDIPKFSPRTQGRLKWREEIVEEKDMKSVSLSSHAITVFRFRDKNGKLTLNFYGEKYDQGRKRRRW